MTLARFRAALARHSDSAYTLLRVGLGLTVLLAGVHKLVSPTVWASYTAPWAADLITATGLSLDMFMQTNGIVEAVFGAAILVDRYTAVSAAVVALALLGIIVNLATAGLTFADVIIRDIGLFLLAVGVTLMAAERRSDG